MTAASDAAEMRHDDVLTAYLGALRAEVSDETWRNYEYILKRAQREMPHGIVAAADHEIQAWVWRHGIGSAYRAQQDAAIRGLHKWMRRKGVSDIDPTADLPRPKQQRGLPRAVPSDQVRDILAHAREPVRTWCYIMCYSGARCAEVANLDREDITPQGMRLLGKGGKERMVPVHPELWPMVRDLPPGPVAHLRASNRPRALSCRVNREMKIVARKLGRPELARVTAHRFRHSIATQLLSETGDLRLVQEFLGHSTPGTTAVYTRVVIGRMAAAVEALPSWGAAGSPDDGAPPAAA